MALRGIAVIDAGSTSTKAMLFNAVGEFVTSRKLATAHNPAPPYAAIDPSPMIAWLPGALAELDAILPVDCIVPCAHGSALACLTAKGELALPIMDYNAEAPAQIRADYERHAPDYAEVFCPTLPLTLSLGLQLWWQRAAWPEAFARIHTIVPWGQYITYVLTGQPFNEVSAIGAQTQLWNPKANVFAKLAAEQGWDKLFAPMKAAWEMAGPMKAKPAGFRGEGRVLVGIHDSDATFLRYLAAGQSSMSLISSGTWMIGFDTDANIETLDTSRDLAAASDVFGRPLASFRFMAGREFEIITQGLAAEPDMAIVENLIARKTFALGSFTASGGPLPGTGGKGRIIGPAIQSPEEAASLASHYCALMISQSLDAVGSRGSIIVDGPFGKNAVFMSLLANLRKGQRVFASDLRDGTAAGAALLALMTQTGKPPRVELKMQEFKASQLNDVETHASEWLRLTKENIT